MGEIVFADKKKLQELNQIVHPYLREAIIRIVEKHKAEIDKRAIFINAAVLKELGLVDYADEIWVVMASRKIRLKRLLQIGLSKKEALARIRSQMNQRQYLELADVRIKNEGTLRELNAKVRAHLPL